MYREDALHFIFIGILFLYSNLLGQVCVCTVLATLLHAIPLSTAVLLYNFATVGVSYVFQWWMNSECSNSVVHSGIIMHCCSSIDPMFVSLPVLIVFSGLVPALINTFPKSFTLAESVIVSHGLVLIFTDVVLQIVNLVCLHL